MDPLSMAFGGIGAVANIFSANQTAQANEYIAELNYQQEQQREQDMVNAARQQEQDRQQQYGDTKLGTTDAVGNRTHFVEGKGWVIDETPQQKSIDAQQRGLDSAQTAEQMQKLTVDAARQRQQSVDTAKDNNKARNLADTFARMLGFTQDNDPTQQGNIDGFNAALAAKAKDTQVLSDAAEQAVRGSGGTNAFSQMAGRVGTNDLAQMIAAFSGGQTQGRQDALKENSANDADYTNMFNNFAGQAKTPVGGSSISPVGTNIYGDTGLNNAQSQGASQMNNDANQLGSALEDAFAHAPVPSMDYEAPNNSIGNAFMQMAGMFAGGGGSNKSKYGSSVSYGSVSGNPVSNGGVSGGGIYVNPAWANMGGIGHSV